MKRGFSPNGSWGASRTNRFLSSGVLPTLSDFCSGFGVALRSDPSKSCSHFWNRSIFGGMKSPRIGFVGVGRMGANMARRLKEVGYVVVAVFDSHQEIAVELGKELGCEAVSKVS